VCIIPSAFLQGSRPALPFRVFTSQRVHWPANPAFSPFSLPPLLGRNPPVSFESLSSAPPSTCSQPPFWPCGDPGVDLLRPLKALRFGLLFCVSALYLQDVRPFRAVHVNSRALPQGPSSLSPTNLFTQCRVLICSPPFSPGHTSGDVGFSRV